jgi:hypothetical protein
MLWADSGAREPRGQDTHGAKDTWGQRMYRCIGCGRNRTTHINGGIALLYVQYSTTLSVTYIK